MHQETLTSRPSPTLSRRQKRNKQWVRYWRRELSKYPARGIDATRHTDPSNYRLAEGGVFVGPITIKPLALLEELFNEFVIIDCVLSCERLGETATDAAQEETADDQLAESELETRRKRNIPVATDRRRAANAAKARQSSERRRLIDPTTCERDYSEDESEFMKTMDRYKRENRRPFPTWSEVLEVLRSMGYRKVAETTDIPRRVLEESSAESRSV